MTQAPASRRKPSGIRLLLVILGALVLGAAALVGGFFWSMHRAITALGGAEADQLLQTLQRPRVVLSAEKLDKSIFADLPGVGEVTDLRWIGDALVAAGEKGAATVGKDGRVRGDVVPMPMRVAEVQVVPRAKGYDLFTPGWHMDGPALYDAAGRVLWKSSRTVDSAAAIDWSGDGDLTFALGDAGGQGVELKGRRGETLWRKTETAAWLMRVLHDERGRPLLVYSTARHGRLVTVDRDGKTRPVDYGTYVGAFADLENGPGVRRGNTIIVLDQPPRVVFGEKSAFNVAGLDGRVLGRYGAPPVVPEAVDLDAYAAVWVPLKNAQDYYLAVLGNLGRYGDRSALYVYDPKGALVHEELLAQRRGALAIIERPDKPNVYRLLLGGPDRVWAYGL